MSKSQASRDLICSRRRAQVAFTGGLSRRSPSHGLAIVMGPCVFDFVIVPFAPSGRGLPYADGRLRIEKGSFG